MVEGEEAEALARGDGQLGASSGQRLLDFGGLRTGALGRLAL